MRNGCPLAELFKKPKNFSEHLKKPQYVWQITAYFFDNTESLPVKAGYFVRKYLLKKMLNIKN